MSYQKYFPSFLDGNIGTKKNKEFNLFIFICSDKLELRNYSELCTRITNHGSDNLLISIKFKNDDKFKSKSTDPFGIITEKNISSHINTMLMFMENNSDLKSISFKKKIIISHSNAALRSLQFIENNKEFGKIDHLIYLDPIFRERDLAYHIKLHKIDHKAKNNIAGSHNLVLFPRKKNYNPNYCSKQQLIKGLSYIFNSIEYSEKKEINSNDIYNKYFSNLNEINSKGEYWNQIIELIFNVVTDD